MELIVVTVVIALTACMAFPVYKIFQQRSKEKRLKKILTDVRAAISGTKSHNSSNDFQEGFRTVARVKGMEIIASNTGSLGDTVKQSNINAFVAKIGQGYGYPKTPEDIWSPNPVATIDGFQYETPSGPMPLGAIPLERPFYRSKPIHPFHDWYQAADFRYLPVTVDGLPNNGEVKLTVEEWKDQVARGVILLGVKDIVSTGAGLALDGSKTDDW